MCLKYTLYSQAEKMHMLSKCQHICDSPSRMFKPVGGHKVMDREISC